MRSYSWILGMVFFTGLSAFSQEKYTKHTVSREKLLLRSQHTIILSPALFTNSIDAKDKIQIGFV
jgi:hypothetical protein